MSIDYYVLCRLEPVIDPSESEWLTWDPSGATGKFGGMWLSLERGDARVKRDELPRPPWKEPIVAVLHAGGRLTDETYDDFYDWARDLARRAHGAVMFEDGKIHYEWTDEVGLEADVDQRIAARDFSGLARILRKHEPTRYQNKAYWVIIGKLWPAFEPTFRQGEAIEVMLALLDGVATWSDPWAAGLDEAAIAVGQLPALAGHRELEQRVAKARERRAQAAKHR